MARWIRFALLLFVGAPLAAQAPQHTLAQPGISPDGTEIAFVSGEDIWTVSADGGEARILIAHSASDIHPMYSPDGRWLAFESNREGSFDIWVMDLESGTLRRLTVESGGESLQGWSPDSRWVYFVTARQDVQGRTDVFRVAVENPGTPMPVLADRYEGEFWASEASDGRFLLSSRGNMARGQWWRNGHSHIDEAEIWLARVSDGADPTYSRVSAGGKNVWPMWGQDGSTAYWISDRDGTENIWSAAAGPDAQPQKLTRFSDGRVIWPTISRSGDVIAFERDFGIWTYRDGRANELDVTLRGAVEGPKLDFRSLQQFQGMALSPDGRKVAVGARGEIFAAAADSGGPARRVTHTRAPETAAVWAADSERIAYLSTRGEYSHLYEYDFTTGTERQLTDSNANDFGPEYSPDGDRILVLRDGRQLVVIDVESGDETVVAEGMLAFASIFAGAGNYAWSPDGEWIAYLAWPTGEFGNVHVVPADGSAEGRPVSFLANTFAGNVQWSGDGSFILYSSNQRTEDTNVFRIDLTPRTPVFREDRFDDFFRTETETDTDTEDESEDESGDEAEAEEDTPLTIDFEGIERRISIVPTSVSVGNMVLSPDGKTLVYTGFAAGRNQMYSVSLDELAPGGPPNQLTQQGGGSLQFGPGGREVWYMSGGRVRKVPVRGGNPSTVNIQAELEVDFHAEKMDVFLQGWRLMRDGFYDEDMHGADWDAVRRDFAPQIAGAKTVGEMRRLLQLMIGELNASHLGAGGASGISNTPSGYLGLHFDRVEYERNGNLRVAEVVDLSPADVSGQIEPGDYIRSVGGQAMGAGVNYHRALLETIGERIEVGVSDTADGEIRTVSLKPVSGGQGGQLRYRQWVAERRAYVEEQSGGRLGYVHMPNMGTGALNQLYLDLDQNNHDKQGVVVDVRNNNGGFVNAYALDVFTRRNYFSMRPRGGLEAPSRLQLGQRALLAPTVLVTDQHTLSDGEDFTEGYRTLGLGPVIGEPTSGWIIYTSNLGLFDGTSFRMPFIEIRGSDGEVMELNPRPVDIEVERPTGESYTGSDAQLDRAIQELLRIVGN